MTANHNPILKNAVHAALRNDSLYQDGTLFEDALCQHVMAEVGDKDGCVENFIGTFDLTGAGDQFQARREAFRNLIKTYPRGTWLVMLNTINGILRYTPVMSAGDNTFSAHDDTFERMPTYQKVRERMVGYEIYCLRRELEGAFFRERSLAAFQRMGLCIGMKFQNFTSGIKTYSQIKITGMTDTSLILLAKETTRKKSERIQVPMTRFEGELNKHKAEQVQIAPENGALCLF